MPLLEGGSAGSLGTADLEAMGVEVVAVNLLELAVSPGLDAIAAAGGLAAFTGARASRVCGVILSVPAGEPPADGDRDGEGWRARRLPAVVRAAGDMLTVRSGVDGSTHVIDTTRLIADGARLGGSPAADIVPGAMTTWWRRLADPLPDSGWVVSSVPADAAREGFYWTPGGWTTIGGEASETPGPLLSGCGCRACATATRGYLAHLWRQREITASHLLGWHNLHQLRGIVEGR